jgi:hypothetical protein
MRFGPVICRKSDILIDCFGGNIGNQLINPFSADKEGIFLRTGQTLTGTLSRGRILDKEKALSKPNFTRLPDKATKLSASSTILHKIG